MKEGGGGGGGEGRKLSSPPSPRSFICAICRAVLVLNRTETLATQANVVFTEALSSDDDNNNNHNHNIILI